MTDTRKPKQPHIDAIFREYYLEELAKNPLYRHLLVAMQNKSQWPQEAWFETLGDLHDYDMLVFKMRLSAYRKSTAKENKAPCG